jgi:putative RNA 2'-phosphotransferase
MKPEERVRTSKFLSLVLRHQPEVIGITLDEAGWVAGSDLLDGCGRHRRPVTLEQLQEIVATNDKKRFEFSPDGSRIRASQGHSVEVELGYSPMVPPEHLYHGTAERSVPSIRAQGLLKCQRHHVHLYAEDRLQTARDTGGRHGRPVILKILSGRMAAEGYQFFLSTNVVWLTDHVPAAYIILAV